MKSRCEVNTTLQWNTSINCPFQRRKRAVRTVNASYELTRDGEKKIYIERSPYFVAMPHFHQQIELLYVLEGSVRVTVNDQSAVLHADNIVVSNSYDIHSYVRSNCMCLLFIIPQNFLNFFYAYMEGKKFRTNFITDHEKAKRIYTLCETVELLQNTANSLTITGLVNAILGLITDAVQVVKQTKMPGEYNIVRDILMIVEQEYSQKLSAEEVAARLGYGKYYFSRLFNKYFHCNFHTYVNRLRIRQFVQAAEATDKPNILTLSYSVGFTSPQTFYRAFYEVYGTTPQKYLNQKQ